MQMQHMQLYNIQVLTKKSGRETYNNCKLISRRNPLDINGCKKHMTKRGAGPLGGSSAATESGMTLKIDPQYSAACLTQLSCKTPKKCALLSQCKHRGQYHYEWMKG